MLRLDVSIKKLEKKILFMMAMTEEIMSQAMKYYFDHEDGLFQSVKDMESKINEYENAIDEHVIKIFALEHPVAFDLRKVVMIMKMNTDLERIGDIAFNIASRAHSTINNNFYGVSPTLTKDPYLLENYEIFQKMLTLVGDSISKQDIKLSEEVLQMDKKIDENNSALFRKVLQQCIETPAYTNFFVNQITISKNLERAGDHCTNLAQELIYIFSGINIKHNNETHRPLKEDIEEELGVSRQRDSHHFRHHFPSAEEMKHFSSMNRGERREERERGRSDDDRERKLGGLKDFFNFGRKGRNHRRED